MLPTPGGSPKPERRSIRPVAAADRSRHPRPRAVRKLRSTWRPPSPRPRPRRPRRGPSPEPDPASIIDPADARLSEVLKEVMHVEAARLENFLGEARDKAGQLRAILKLPARDPQAFREKLVLILELIRGINARARAPAAGVGVRARGALRRGARQPARQEDAVGKRFPAHRRETRRPAEPSRHPG